MRVRSNEDGAWSQFVVALVARIERSEIRGRQCRRVGPLPDYASLNPGYDSLSHRQLKRELIDHLVTVRRDDEGMAEKNPEQAVRRDRVGLRHSHHAGLEYLVVLARLGAFGEYMRGGANDVDAVDLGRTRLHAVLAKELCCDAHIVDRIARFDLGNDALVAGQSDLVPEFLYYVGRLADADRRADLRRVAPIAGRKLHNDDVAVAKLALGRAWIAEEHGRIRHRGRTDNQEIDVAAAPQDGGAGGAAEIGFGRAGLCRRHHRLHGVLAQQPGAPHTVKLGLALDNDKLVNEAARKNDLGVRQAGAQIIVLVHRHVIPVARIDLDEADPRPRKAKLPDAFDHHLRVAAATTLAHIGEGGLDVAAHR